MTGVHDRILAAVRQLAAEQPADAVSLADVARTAGVSWPTVRRHVGSKARLRELLTTERPETAPPAIDTRKRILAGASHVFARWGYNGATLDHVALEAGLTKGAVYWHFASKSDLFLALIEEHILEQSRTLPGMVQGIDSVEGLAAVLNQLFAALKAEQDWPQLVQEFSASRRDPRVSELLQELHSASHEIGRDATRRAQDEGRLSPDLDPDAVTLLFSALLNGLVQFWLIHPALVDIDEAIPALARILWHGIGPHWP